MLLALMFPLVTSAATGLVLADAQSTQDPPVRVWFKDGDRFTRGDHARVRVKARDDGYLVVLRATPEGRVRVLFPLDPGDDDFVRGGKTYEIKGRGDRESFTIEDSEGTGTVFAAVSSDPFHFDEFVRGDHWDYGVLGATRVSREAEPELTDLVQRMAEGSHFDYDLISYQVESQVAYDADYYSAHAGYGYYYRPYYDPFYDPFYDPWFYRPGFSFGLGLVFGPRYRYYDPFYYDPWYYRPVYSPYRRFYYYTDPFSYRRGYLNPVYVNRFGRHYGGLGPYTFKPPLTPVGTVTYRPRFITTGNTRPAATRPFQPADPRRRGDDGISRGNGTWRSDSRGNRPTDDGARSGSGNASQWRRTVDRARETRPQDESRPRQEARPREDSHPGNQGRPREADRPAPRQDDSHRDSGRPRSPDHGSGGDHGARRGSDGGPRESHSHGGGGGRRRP